jgi:SAM-dependent methyltransferase
MSTLFARYLEAKRTVDDRALNKDVLERLRVELAARGVRRQQVLEVGAGIGTMLTRLIEWRVLQHADYILLDQDAELLEIGRRRLVKWAAARGAAVEELADGLRLRAPDLDFTVHFLAGELHSLLSSNAGPNDVDLLIANAFLDIVDLPWTLPRLLERVVQGGLYWFCINFDGESIFLPEHADDAQLLQAYHRSMDERVRDGRRTGDSKTGRRLFSHLAQAGARVFAAGASDWVVHPASAGYPADEADFLRHILNTIEQELGSHAGIQAPVLAAWTEARKRQLERGELHFIAHQLDYCGEVVRAKASG